MVEISEEDDLQSPPPPSNNNEKKSINQLKPSVEFKRQRKLTSEDGLKEVDDAIIKVRNIVKYYKGSQSRRQRFLSSVAHVELQSSRGLRQDVPTQWNLTYIMLDSVLYYKKAFIHLAKTDANYLHCPTSDEWGRIERTFKFLKVFYEVTCAFSGSKYITTNLYFANVLTVRVLLHKEKDSDDTFVKNMASRMYEKFEKYWANFSTVMAFAAVLDPRYKYHIVEWGYEKFIGTNFDTFSNKVTSQAVKSELECYLEEKLMPRVNNLNILDYWKTYEVRYPTLARIARDILAIPISTVASESVFSIGVQMEAHLEALCGAIMTEKIEDQEESNIESEVRVDESGSRVT
ncbi:zinc finger BED domain-containing protein RICESLEEPER 2-like [Cynara cardunculus var. scolymus]|uniref:zinc finger BED domain-containing protein RICESLEEPER 2-like n=1 Tax=Cynara cardunculus var. scolymus TaxID=59895 RepID=UPI000D6242BA|nr:zinc finger BED domain-containing protein RICESLEEPER 2-like [Cynara cardunculus var. scolymus]